MDYQSTRSNDINFKAGQAVLAGIAPDGGLFVQRGFNRFPMESLASLSFYDISAKVLSLLMDDFSEDELRTLIRSAYSGRFESDEVTPTVSVGDGNTYILELYRGPTSAFKDVALCVLPRLMTASKKKYGMDEDVLILTATSGDTGKAALSGFMDVEGVRIIVFYPHGGVSAVQQAQMVTQEGKNVAVCAIRGNFDDAQTAVKQAFAAFDPNDVKGRKVKLSSANSINIGRLAPQVAYYFKAYADLIGANRIKLGDRVDFVVPTGNFGDILAGYIAKRMGLPVGTLVCASNENDILADFIATGVYDTRRPFHKTLSPSMDILISSNLERLLFLLSGYDTELVSKLMRELKQDGRYEFPKPLLDKLQSEFAGFRCNDADALYTIGKVWRENGYLMDTHTAVAYNALEQYRHERGSNTPAVVLSTASPYKFPEAVLKAIDGTVTEDGFAAMERLNALTGVPVPEALAGLRQKTVIHNDVIEKCDIMSYIMNKAGLEVWRK